MRKRDRQKDLRSKDLGERERKKRNVVQSFFLVQDMLLQHFIEMLWSFHARLLEVVLDVQTLWIQANLGGSPFFGEDFLTVTTDLVNYIHCCCW